MFSCVSLTSPLTSQNLGDARKYKANVELICPVYCWNTGLGIFQTPVLFILYEIYGAESITKVHRRVVIFLLHE